MSTLQDRLREAMAAKPRVSQAQIARACGISPPSVNDWLSGKTKSLIAENLLPTARILEVNPDWLASGKGRMVDPLDWPLVKPAELDLNVLKSAVVSIKEAIKKADVEPDVFLAAPAIAFAYRERAKLPQDLSQQDLKLFDQMIWAYLQGEISSGRRTGSAAGGSEEGIPADAAEAPKGRRRAK
jgi:transcriptional regulator with XRE-family HTH domain